MIERVRFTDVARRTAEWAELVREHGVQPGDRVIVLAGRDREWRFALLGVIMAGGVAVPFPASTPARELQAIASDANAVLFVSARARLDLAAPDGPRALSSDDLERRHKALAAQHVPHLATPADVALIVSDYGPDGLRGAVHTHASLAEGAEVAERWLGIRAGDRLWSTVANGSIESIWLLLGAWRVGGEIVDVDHPFDLEAELELLARFQPATIWFSDEEYAALAVVRASEWIEPGSIRCAVTSREAAGGAKAFERSFGATVVTVDVSRATGVRPVGDAPPVVEQDSADVFEGADPKLLAALAAVAPAEPDLPVAAPSSREEAKLRKQAERAAAEERRRVEAAERAQREAAAAEERKRADEEKRREDERARDEAKRQKEAERVAAEERKAAAAAERHRAEEEKRIATERKRETAKIRKLAEREAAKERSRVEEEERARRDAAAAAERKRAEEEKRREAERAREGAKAKKEAEREAEKAKRSQREAEAAAERARVEEEKRREAGRAQADAKTRKEAERQAEKERRRAEEVQRAERQAAAAAERKRAEEEKRLEAEREREEAKSRKLAERAAAKERRRVEGERARKRQHDAEERAERERLAPDILSSISQYGIGASSLDSGRDGETATAPSAAPTPDTRRDA